MNSLERLVRAGELAVEIARDVIEQVLEDIDKKEEAERDRVGFSASAGGAEVDERDPFADDQSPEPELRPEPEAHSFSVSLPDPGLLTDLKYSVEDDLSHDEPSLEPTAEESTPEEPAAEEPAFEEPAAEESAFEEPAPEEPAEPSPQEPVLEFEPEPQPEPLAAPVEAPDANGKPDSGAAAEQLSSSIIENSQEAFVGMDSEGVITDWNPAAAATFGWTPEEAMGQPVADAIVPEELRDDFQEALTRFLATGESEWLDRRLEQTALHREGHEFPVDMTISAVEGPDGWRFFAFLRDASGRQQEETAQARLAAIVESSDDAVIGKTLDGEITSWNRGAEDLFGYTAEDAVGRPIWLVVPQDRPGEVPKVLDRVREGEPVEPIESQRVTKDGRRLDISLVMSPIRDASGEIIGASTVARDITARRRAERYREVQLSVARALAESSTVDEAMPKLLGTLGESLDWDAGIYWAAEGEGDLRAHGFWSREGLEAGELEETSKRTSFGVGQGLPGRVAADRDPVWTDQGLAEIEGDGARVSAASAAGLEGVVGLPLVGENEVIGVIEMFASQGRPADEELLDAMSVVSGQVANYAARKKAEAAAEKLKDDFFGLVSHELRTPLTSVIGYTEMLAKTEGDQLSARGQKFVDVIRRNAQREMRLVGDLLMLVRVEAGTFELQAQELELPSIVEASVENSRPAATDAGVDLVTEAGEIPPIQGDPERLGQVVDNLINNAIKFTPEGGRVQVGVARLDDVAIIEVRDTGPGIPPEDLERLFDRLYRASSATEDHVPGTGLGLTIVKAIVEAHGGRVKVESKVGSGSAFRVELPITSAAANSETGGVEVPTEVVA